MASAPTPTLKVGSAPESCLSRLQLPFSRGAHPSPEGDLGRRRWGTVSSPPTLPAGLEGAPEDSGGDVSTNAGGLAQRGGDSGAHSRTQAEPSPGRLGRGGAGRGTHTRLEGFWQDFRDAGGHRSAGKREWPEAHDQLRLRKIPATTGADLRGPLPRCLPALARASESGLHCLAASRDPPCSAAPSSSTPDSNPSVSRV